MRLQGVFAVYGQVPIRALANPQTCASVARPSFGSHSPAPSMMMQLPTRRLPRRRADRSVRPVHPHSYLRPWCCGSSEHPYHTARRSGARRGRAIRTPSSVEALYHGSQMRWAGCVAASRPPGGRLLGRFAPNGLPDRRTAHWAISIFLVNIAATTSEPRFCIAVALSMTTLACRSATASSSKQTAVRVESSVVSIPIAPMDAGSFQTTRPFAVPACEIPETCR
jgi:hypothetical protein